MSDACNRTFPEIFSEQLPISFYKPFDPEEGLLATVVSTIFSAVPVFGDLGEIATKATIKEIEIFWSGVGSTASAIAADSVSPETTITTDLVQALLSTAVEYRVGVTVTVHLITLFQATITKISKKWRVEAGFSFLCGHA